MNASNRDSNQITRVPPLVPRWISIIRAFKFVSNPIPILSENMVRYGSTYRFHIGGLKEGIVTRDMRVIKHVLQKNHRNYRKSDIQGNILAKFVGKGLLTSDGDFWLRQRRLIQPGFKRSRINELIALMQLEIGQFLDHLSDRIRAEPTIDIHKEMHHLAFRIVARTLFSTSLAEDKLVQLAEQISEIQSFIIKLIRQPYAKWWFSLTGLERKKLEIAHQIKITISQIITERRASSKPKDDLLQMLLDARYEDDGASMSESQILDECLIIFVAGHETSANALSWAIQLCGSHPNEMAQLREEVEALPDIQDIQFKQVDQLKYSRQVISEALRLYPPGWVLDRVAREDDEIGPWRIPRGSVVFLYVYGAHRSDEYWLDPDKFVPERFTKDNLSLSSDHAYLPFGAGPRLCIGNHFAMLEMQLVLSRMVHRFDFESCAKSISLAPMITLRPRGGIFISISNRR